MVFHTYVNGHCLTTLHVLSFSLCVLFECYNFKIYGTINIVCPTFHLRKGADNLRFGIGQIIDTYNNYYCLIPIYLSNLNLICKEDALVLISSFQCNSGHNAMGQWEISLLFCILIRTWNLNIDKVGTRRNVESGKQSW